MPENVAQPIAVDIREACRLSGLGRSFLYERLASGDIRSVHAGRRRLVIVASIAAYLESLPSATTENATVSA